MLVRRAREMTDSYSNVESSSLVFYLVLLLLVPLYAWISIRYMMPFAGKIGLYALFAVLFPVFIFGSRIGGRRRFERKSREYIAVAAGHGYCPACGYTIASLRP